MGVSNVSFHHLDSCEGRNQIQVSQGMNGQVRKWLLCRKENQDKVSLLADWIKVYLFSYLDGPH